MAELAGTVATNCIRLFKLYQLSHQGSPRILERVAYPFSSDLPDKESNRGLRHCRWILYQLSYREALNSNYIQSN